MAESNQSLDISIKSLKDYVFDLKTKSLQTKRASEIVNQPVIISEKIDGTKLTLVRTSSKDPKDYTKNWIVAYKGSILRPKEFAYMTPASKADITSKSIGISQYSLVFDHLQRINSKIGSIPTDTEFSVEFAQNKDTLTRDYAVKGGMFLRSYAKVKYRIVSGDLVTVPVGPEIVDYDVVKKMADVIDIPSFPLIHRGKLTQDSLMSNPLLGPKMTNTNWSDPVDVLKNFSAAALSLPSALSDEKTKSTAEGVVLQMPNNTFFKVVQADQYDKKTRDLKKDMYKLPDDVATSYFQQMRALIEKIFDKIGVDGKSDEDIISDVNFYIAQNEKSLNKFFRSLIKLAGGKKDITKIKDDVHDTVRLLLGKQQMIGKETKSVALIPIAGKPLHIGHWKLIELAASENDSVVVYTSSSDRKRPGEFPIFGADLITIWTDIFIPALPKNVKVKFVATPKGSAVHELDWFETRMVHDKKDVPNVNLYSDIEDIDKNFSDKELQEYPLLMKSGKVKKVGVERTSTVNISGTAMREFLQNGDKESFKKYLPPVSSADKDEIWNTLYSRKPVDMKEDNPYALLAEELINKVAKEMFNEGGWRNPDTQEWEVTPKIVGKIVSAMEEFLTEFNIWSELPLLKTKGPTGSGKYWKDDLNDPTAVYGDVDMQMVLPVESNERKDQLESNKLFDEKIREFVQTKKPSYIHDGSNDPDFGLGYLIFNIDGKKIQVDLVLSYSISADWTSVRTTPQKGLKGFVTGMVLSALGDALNVVLGSSTNPYINTLDGKVVSSAVKKNAKQVFLKPNEVFADVVRFYGKKAGIENANVSALSGHMGLDANDPSLKKKLETVVALANAFEQNGIFKAGVIVSNQGEVIKSKLQFIDNVRNTYIGMMERAKTAKKLEKAQTPSAMRTIEKIKKDANLGIELAKQIIREQYMLLNESGQSIASVDPKTPKMVDGHPAQATTKLKIVDATGKDKKNLVSSNVKELIYALNEKVGFWKKNNPYIENGFVFNGSSQYLMSGDEKYKDLSKYKDSFGDIDVIVPEEKLDELEIFLDSIDDNKVNWKPTLKNKLSNSFYYVGRTKNLRALAGQTVTLWYYAPMQQIVQIDFEGDEMVPDPQGYEKPSEWIKFIKDSPYIDLQVGIKGLAGAILLRGLTRAATALPNAVYVTNVTAAKIESGQLKSLIDAKGKSVVSTNATHALPSQYTLNTSGSGHQGIRKAYRLVAKGMDYLGKKVDVYTDIPSSESKPADRIGSVSKVFELIFKRKPNTDDIASFRSYIGLLTLMKSLPKEVQNKALERAKEGFAQAGLDPKDYAPIQKAAKEILGIVI